jgi:type III pantothenate kinase
VALSSVVPEAKEALTCMARKLVEGEVMVVGPGVKTGLAINIDVPHEVGADRVVNSVAAREKYGTPVISVDFGTSTNFDVVDAEGAYIGGVIAPGLEVSEDALISATAALRRVEIREPRSSIGRNTVEAMQSGLIYGHAGLVDGIVERLAVEVGGEAALVATGGLASTIVPHCRTIETVDDRLTLDGLRLIFERNPREDR